MHLNIAEKKIVCGSIREQLTLGGRALGHQPLHILSSLTQLDVLFHSKQFIH